MMETLWAEMVALPLARSAIQPTDNNFSMCIALLSCQRLHIDCTVRTTIADGLLQQGRLRGNACLQLPFTSRCAFQCMVAGPFHLSDMTRHMPSCFDASGLLQTHMQSVKQITWQLSQQRTFPVLLEE